MIKKTHNSFFKKDGFLLDDASDPFKKRQYIDYFTTHHTDYICSQDADLRNLLCFREIKYLTIPEEAEHYQDLENISGLIGLELCGTQLSMIPLSVKKNLRYIIVHCSNDNMILAGFPNLLELKMDGFPGFQNPDCQFLIGVKLKRLSICSRNLKSLKGIEFLSELEELELASCSSLNDVSQITYLNNLKTLILYANNRLNSSLFNHLPISVERLSILGTENSARKNKFYSFAFLRRLKNLKEFFTNWKVDSQLLKQEDYGSVRIVIYEQDS